MAAAWFIVFYDIDSGKLMGGQFSQPSDSGNVFLAPLTEWKDLQGQSWYLYRIGYSQSLFTELSRDNKAIPLVFCSTKPPPSNLEPWCCNFQDFTFEKDSNLRIIHYSEKDKAFILSRLLKSKVDTQSFSTEQVKSYSKVLALIQNSTGCDAATTIHDAMGQNLPNICLSRSKTK